MDKDIIIKVGDDQYDYEKLTELEGFYKERQSYDAAVIRGLFVKIREQANTFSILATTFDKQNLHILDLDKTIHSLQQEIVKLKAELEYMNETWSIQDKHITKLQAQVNILNPDGEDLTSYMDGD